MAFHNVTVILGDPRVSDSYQSSGQYGEEATRNVAILKEALSTLSDYRFEFLDNHATLLDDLRTRRPEFVLNLCDTGFRNQANRELNLPAYFELLDIPYSGATPSCMVLTLDKAVVRAVAAEHGVPVPEETYLGPDDSADRLPDRFPVLIKPARTDGSFGITQRAVAATRAEAEDYLVEVRRKIPGEAMLVQEFLSGTEYGLGIIGNTDDKMTILPPLEIDYGALDPSLPRILGYESKAEPGSPYWTDVKIVKATLDDREREQITDYAKRLYARFGFRDYGRFDFRRDVAGRIKLMEMNTNPAWAWDAKLAFMAGFADLPYEGMFALILEAAQRRLARESAR